MLPRAHRLRGDQSFQRLMRNGRSVYGNALSLRTAPNGLKETRFAFVVSTKVHKRAVVRNTLRRRMREIVRKQMPNVRPGYDALVAARRQALEYDFPKLSAAIVDLLVKSRLL